MSIASELADLAGNKAAIKSAIEAKSPSTMPTDALAQWPTAIASISTEEPEETYSGRDTIITVKVEAGDYVSLVFGGVYGHPVFQWGDGTEEPIQYSFTGYKHTYEEAGEYDLIIHSETDNDGVSLNGDGLTLYKTKVKIGTNLTCSTSNRSLFIFDGKLILNKNSPLPLYSNACFAAFSIMGLTEVVGTIKTSIPVEYLVGLSNDGVLLKNSWLKGEFVNGATYNSSTYRASDACSEVTWDVTELDFGENGSWRFNNLMCLQKINNLRKIIASNMTGLFSNCALLQDLSEFSFIGITNAYLMFRGCCSLKHIPAVLDLSQCTDTRDMFNNCQSLRAIPKILDMSSVKTADGMFNRCNVLRKIPDVLDLSQCTDCNSMFYLCSTLEKTPDVLDLSQCTDTRYMFMYCSNLKYVPDVINLSSATKTDDMFRECSSLLAVPTHLTAQSGYSLKFNFSYSSLVDEDTVASFDANGDIIGGMIYNLNDLSSGTNNPTLTFHADVKTRINNKVSDGWNKVKAMANAKGWNISPA